MRKFLLLTLLAVLFTAVNVPSSSAAFYDIGSTGNSWEDAYVIASPEDMTLLRDRINAGEESEGKYYKLNADISLTDWQAIGSFTGHLDGQNHTLTINGTQGLFDEITVSNNEIAVRNLNLTGTVRNYGSILASKLESGIIENCKLEDVTLSGTS